jgi:hypothetical protein
MIKGEKEALNNEELDSVATRKAGPSKLPLKNYHSLDPKK